MVADYLDGSLPSLKRGAQEVHLDESRACRKFLAAYRRAVGVAKAVLENASATAEPPEYLIQAILVSLER